MRRLLRLLHLAAEADRAVVHPRHQEIERAALRMLVKAGMDGHARLWPNPLVANRKPALLIQVDKASRRFSQVALGLLGDYCITYVAQHFELELDRVFWSPLKKVPAPRTTIPVSGSLVRSSVALLDQTDT